MPAVVSLCGFSNSAHNAGDSVSAFSVENNTETEMVIANCWKSRPVIPPENETGTNTASRTMVVAIIGDVTLPMASIVASFGDMPFPIFTCTASTTTIASSTTSPMASTRPSSETMFMVKPSSGNATNVPMSDTGIAISGISVARQS